MVIIELKSTNSLYTKWQASIKSAIILGNFARRTSFWCGVTRQTITSIEVEKFINDFQSRIGILVCYNSVLIIMASFGLFHPTAGQSEFTLSFMSVVNVGLYVAV